MSQSYDFPLSNTGGVDNISNVGIVFSTTHDSATGTIGAHDGSDPAGSQRVHYTLSSPFFQIYRYFLNFDLKKLPIGANIISANIVINVFSNNYRNDAGSSIIIVPSTAGLSSLATTDYQSWSASNKGGLALASFTLDALNLIPVTDLTFIVPGADLKLALINSLDLSNTSPVNANILLLAAASYSTPPVLRIVYDLPGGAQII